MRQLLDTTEHGDNEVRIELFGSGNYILKKDLALWIKKNSGRIASEMSRNMEYPYTKPNKNMTITRVL